jgi:probable O-glycosylation ligase (exosortase A-associated)
VRDIALAMVLLACIPIIFKRPWFGIIVWTWIAFMNPHKQAWGFMTEMPVALVIALVTLASILRSQEPKKIPWTRESVTLAIFVVWMTFTTFFALYPSEAWPQWDKVIKIQFMIFIAMMVINDPFRLNVLVWTIALSIGYYGVKGGIFTILHGGVYRVYGPSGSFIADNNCMGLALAMTVPLMYYLYREQAKRWYVRWGLLGAMLLTALAAFGTHSRGALLGMGAMGVMFWWKSRQKFFTALLGFFVAVFVYNFMPQEWFDRMSTIKTYDEEVSAQNRFDSWRFAYNLALSRITGGGFETFAGRSDAHSIYFEVMGEHGFVGFGLFVLLGIFTWLKAGSIRRKTEKVPELAWMALLARMSQVSLVAYATAGAFLGMGYFDYPYNLVLILVICQAILAKSSAEQARGSVDGLAAGAQVIPRRRVPTGASP